MMDSQTSQKPTLLIKIGSQLITDGKTIKHENIDRISSQILKLNSKYNIILVTSGSIGLGMIAAKLTTRPVDTPTLQALAARGQHRLVTLWDATFHRYNPVISGAQILVSANHLLEDSTTLLDTLKNLWEQNSIPIVNANDSLDTSETLKDNDKLSCILATIIAVDVLIIVSSHALYEKNPNLYPDAQLIKSIEGILPKDLLTELQKGEKSHLGTGGMLSKVQNIMGVVDSTKITGYLVSSETFINFGIDNENLAFDGTVFTSQP